MAKLTEEQLNNITNNKPLGLVRIDNFFTDELRIEKFDEVDSFNFDGHTIKNFYRVNADIFSYVFEDIKANPECSFVTPYNDVVKEGVIPETVSVLIKETRKGFEERLGSQFMNYYEIHTPVNVAVAGEDIFGEELQQVAENDEELRRKVRRYHQKDGMLSYVVSFDFASEGETFKEFSEPDERKVFFVYAKHAMEYMTEQFSKLLNSKRFKNVDSNKKDLIMAKLREDFMMSMLVRRIVFQDTDFNNSNVGVIIKGDDIQLVNFDYEYCFHNVDGALTSRNIVDFAKQEFPDVWKKFLNKSTELLKNMEGSDERTLRTTIGNRKIIDGILMSLKYLVNTYSKTNTSNM